MSGSIDSLFKSMKSDCEFKIMEQSSLLAHKSGDQVTTLRQDSKIRLSYLTRKGVFPYDWAKSIHCYQRPSLVEKKDFFNTLTQNHISDEDYKFAREVWDAFNMSKMQDYMELYCMTGI